MGTQQVWDNTTRVKVGCMWYNNWRCKNTKSIVFPHPNATNKHNKRGITIVVVKIQRFGIGVRVKVGCGITIDVAKIQSQLFSHTQTRPKKKKINNNKHNN